MKKLISIEKPCQEGNIVGSLTKGMGQGIGIGLGIFLVVIIIVIFLAVLTYYFLKTGMLQTLGKDAIKNIVGL